MPPRQRRAMVVSRRTRTVPQRTPQAQTSEIFKLLVEILFEIFSYFDDHRRFVRQIGYGRPTDMNIEHVERSTVIRKLTMTCWAMRHSLLPVLWEDVEGCLVFHPGGHTYGLYRQCVYLLSNPDIAAYVRIFSVDLRFRNSPKDLMKKFVDTLIQLPNLRTLELLSVDRKSPITAGLKLKRATFPNIREIITGSEYPYFFTNCPDLESLVFKYGLMPDYHAAIESCGAGLKRMVGVDALIGDNISYVVQHCPKLREIGLSIDLRRETEKTLEHLRRIDNLAVIEISFMVYVWNHSRALPHLQEERRKVWKRDSIDVLKNSPSKNRKFLRWRTVCILSENCPITEREELEVFPETTL